MFAGFWANESKTTRNVLARIPENSDYKPDPKSRSAFELASHIAPMPPTMRAVAEAYEQQSAAILKRWQALPADKWAGSLEFFGSQRPASPMAWSFLFDIVHHRGQITTYLRPMGSKVPQIYGPSGDEP